ncbi:MAG: hypothetical protein MR997_04945 [Bacteroidales bacterium]|nr:hypothetical protein [Bacteroidales bacterium]
MSELKISDGGKGAKDPAAKLPGTVGFAPRGGLRLEGRGAKDPAAKLPDTAGFAPRGGLRRDGEGGERSGSQTAGHSRIRPKRRV